MTNIFEKASRTKVRFEHPRGNFTVEQLWELPLKSTVKVSLNELAEKLVKILLLKKLPISLMVVLRLKVLRIL